MSVTRSPRPWLIGLGVATLACVAVATVALRTAPVRGSVRCYMDLLAAVNAQDVATVRGLCSRAYLKSHALKPAAEGGLVGFPRFISKNFQAWREGDRVWLCPGNRVGPIYQFVDESGAWRFDGPVGILRPRGEVLLLPDSSALPDTPEPPLPE